MNLIGKIVFMNVLINVYSDKSIGKDMVLTYWKNKKIVDKVIIFENELTDDMIFKIHECLKFDYSKY